MNPQDENPQGEPHWSEASGNWYYVGTVEQQYDHLIHDVEAEILEREFLGMWLLWKNGTSKPVPKTRDEWQWLAASLEMDAEEPVCVGQVKDRYCIPIGDTTEEDDED